MGDTARGRWRVRWAVAGREHCKSFPARPLADAFLTRLKDAARDRQPFDQATGLPVTQQQEAAAASASWYEHARGCAEAKWPHLAPTSRRSAAEALTTVTAALVSSRRGAPDTAVLHRALFAWAFNPSTRNLTEPAEIAAALDWITRASLPVAALDDAASIRAALGACARTGAGTPAAATTRRRKRAVFYNAVGRTAAAELQPDRPDPVEDPRRRSDRRPPCRRRSRPGRQAARRRRRHSDRGRHLEAFYACLYYAALRPSEAVMLRVTDCHLPSRG